MGECDEIQQFFCGKILPTLKNSPHQFLSEFNSQNIHCFADFRLRKKFPINSKGHSWLTKLNGFFFVFLLTFYFLHINVSEWSSYVHYVNTQHANELFLLISFVFLLIRHKCTNFCWLWIVTVLLLQLCNNLWGKLFVDAKFDKIEFQCFPDLWWCH